MRLARDSPSPQPRFFVVKPGRKTLVISFFLMPLPVSATSMVFRPMLVPTLMVMRPSPSMASTAFLQRFSMTHSNSCRFIIAVACSSSMFVSMMTLCDVRRSIYPTTFCITSARDSSLSSGVEPILEKRSAMSCSLLTSLSISGMSASSGYVSRSISTHAISDDIGVPSWWAVSFDRPTQTLFCSARLEVRRAKTATMAKRMTTPSCIYGYVARRFIMSDSS